MEDFESFMRFVMDSEIEDALVLKKGTFREVNTRKRTEILQTLDGEDVGSIRELARHLDRKVSAVHKDLKVLLEADIISMRKTGQRKVPEIKHTTVLCEPLNYRTEDEEA